VKNTPSPKANGDVGAPDDFPNEWYSRGYLPHREAKEFLQAVTLRLADSLPQQKLTLLEEGLSELPENQRSTHRPEKIEQWLDAGMGCCALRHPKLTEQMRHSLQHFDDQRYRLIAWCIMPNHVHTLMETLTPIAQIVQGWKSVTARWVLAHNEEPKPKSPAPAPMSPSSTSRNPSETSHHPRRHRGHTLRHSRVPSPISAPMTPRESGVVRFSRKLPRHRF
jgi:REP element-mobilizing transposase RayT